MNTKQFLDGAHKTFQKCEQILLNKNKDYSGSNDDPFKNFKNSLVVKVDPIRGVLVRIMDKISRISNLLDEPPAVTDEKIEDTIEDAINYLNIVLQMIKDKNNQ